MIIYIQQLFASQASVFQAMPPHYLDIQSFAPRLFSAALFLAVAILVIVPWKRFEKYKKNFMSAYTVVLAVTHFSITGAVFSAFSAILSKLIFYTLLYTAIMMLNTNEVILKTTSLLSVGYLIGCQVAILLGFTLFYKFLIAVLIGLGIALIARKMDQENHKMFLSLFLGWILFIFLDLIAANKILDQASKPQLYFTMIPKIVLALTDALAVFVAMHNKKVEELSNAAMSKVEETV